MRASRGKVKRMEEQMKGRKLGSETFREVKFKLAGAQVWQQAWTGARSQEGSTGSEMNVYLEFFFFTTIRRWG